MKFYIILALIISLIIIISWYLITLYLLRKRIDNTEKKIKLVFRKRTNLIPSLFEVTKPNIERHSFAFKEIMYLRKIEYLNWEWYKFYEFINLESKIHHEIEFLFRLFEKSPKLEKNWKFLYLKDKLLEISNEIWEELVLYRFMIEKYNNILPYKNFTIFWVLLPYHKKHDII